jgi:dienelactone hydrolase
MRTGTKAAIAAVTTLSLLGVVAWPYVRTVAFLLDVAGVEDGVRRWIPVGRASVTWSDQIVPTRHGTMEVRVYEPDTRDAPAVLVLPGVHGGGVDSPRLVTLCGRLAASGYRVVCAPLPELRQYRITSRSTDMIEDAAIWLLDSAFAPGGRATLVGVSFAGGLTLVAAGRDSIRDRLNAVVSIGGHGSLARTLKFLTTGTLPDGSHRRPHDYAVAVVALSVVEDLVPDDQAEGLRDIVHGFLDASLDGRAGTPEGAALLEELAATAATLPEPARAIALAVLARDVRSVGQAVAPHVGPFGEDPALSPDLSPRPSTSVFLLHGTEDSVIPSTETPLTARDLEAHGTEVRWLLTPLLTHAHLITSAPLADLWALVDFWHAIRAATD